MFFNNSRQNEIEVRPVIISQPVYLNSVEPIYSTANRDDYIVFSLITCFMFDWIFGIPAIYYSCNARNKFSDGLYEDGRNHAKKAKYLNIVGLVIYIIFGIVFGFNFNQIYNYLDGKRKASVAFN